MSVSFITVIMMLFYIYIYKSPSSLSTSASVFLSVSFVCVQRLDKCVGAKEELERDLYSKVRHNAQCSCKLKSKIIDILLVESIKHNN